MPLEGIAFSSGFGRLLLAATIWLAAAVFLICVGDRQALRRWSTLWLCVLLTSSASYLTYRGFTLADSALSCFPMGVSALCGFLLCIKACSSLTAENLREPAIRFVSVSAGLALLCVASSIAALVIESRVLAGTSTIVGVVSFTHQLATCCFTAVCLVCAVELTWKGDFSSAGSKHVHAHQSYKFLNWLALALLLVELAVCFSFFFKSLFGANWSEDLPAEEVRLLLASHAFVLTLLPVAWMCWMIPHRMGYLFRQDVIGKAKPRAMDWVTLALASWILLLVMVLSTTLPLDWPWNALK